MGVRRAMPPTLIYVPMMQLLVALNVADKEVEKPGF